MKSKIGLWLVIIYVLAVITLWVYGYFCSDLFCGFAMLSVSGLPWLFIFDFFERPIGPDMFFVLYALNGISFYLIGLLISCLIKKCKT